MYSPIAIAPEFFGKPVLAPAYLAYPAKKIPQCDNLELVTDGYLLLDELHNVTYLSGKAEAWLEATALEVLGERCWRFLPAQLAGMLLKSRVAFVDVATVSEARWFHSSRSTWLKIRLSRRAKGWLLSFHEEHVATQYAQRAEPQLETPKVGEALYKQEVLAATEAERCRIARELHDGLGQYVTALRYGLDNLMHELENAQTETDSVMKLQSMVEQFDQEFHHVALKLRPPATTERRLKAAVLQYTLEWSERAGVRVDLHCPDDDFSLAPDIETSLYRILQEALNNIQKYARARRVSVILERRHGHLQLLIEDDGCGFDLAQLRTPSSAGRKIGLASMTERAALAGGTCEIEASPGQGTTIFIRVPLTQEEV